MTDLTRILTDNPRQEILYNVPFPAYRKMPGINPSSVKPCNTSLWHARHALLNDSDSESMLVGRALHTAFLERELYLQRYEPEKPRTKKRIEEAAERGVELLLPDKYEEIVEASLRAAQHPSIRRFTKACKTEVVILTEEFGVQCKHRLDLVGTDELCILDVKSAKDIGEWPFSTAFHRTYRYDVQLGLYRRALRKVTGQQDIPVYMLLIENHAPWDFTIAPKVNGEAVPIPEVVLDRGEREGLVWIGQIIQAIKSDVWPGIADQPDWTLQTPYGDMLDDDELKFDEGENGNE